jgi:hypothetical protein
MAYATGTTALLLQEAYGSGKRLERDAKSHPSDIVQPIES